MSHAHCPQALQQKIIANTNDKMVLMFDSMDPYGELCGFGDVFGDDIRNDLVIFALNMNTFHDD